jgi:subtilisin family serine protease
VLLGDIIFTYGSGMGKRSSSIMILAVLVFALVAVAFLAQGFAYQQVVRKLPQIGRATASSAALPKPKYPIVFIPSKKGFHPLKKNSHVYLPNDPGRNGKKSGWEADQWNFVGPYGVNAPQAWKNLIKDKHPGGKGVIVAVLDTGVAYKNFLKFRMSPDFSSKTFVKGYNFAVTVAGHPYPPDLNGHGTFIANEIAEATNNSKYLTGLAYGVKIMPVAVQQPSGGLTCSMRQTELCLRSNTEQKF